MFRFPFYGYPYNYNYYRYYNQIPQNNISNFEKEANKNILKEKISWKKYLMILGVFINVFILALIK